MERDNGVESLDWVVAIAIVWFRRWPEERTCIGPTPIVVTQYSGRLSRDLALGK